MAKYRKLPAVIEAVQFNGSSTHAAQIRRWMDGEGPCPDKRGGIHTCDIRNLEINTLEGVMIARPGDWVIKGIRGEFYPCQRDIFAATYEEFPTPPTALAEGEER